MNPTGRKENTLKKLARMNAALRHEEPDRVPISDFFWGAFVERWRRELGLEADASPLTHYDLDWTVITPNLDPWVRPFDVLRETPEEVVVKTGFGATVHKRLAHPMPEMRAWDVDSFEKLERSEFDDPADPRRFFEPGDSHINGIGDGYQRQTPAWIETVRANWPDFPVYGSVIEMSECLTRLVGQLNAMLWMGEQPDRMGAVIHRLGDFYYRLAEAEIAASEGLLDGFVIWGDMAYKKSTFMSPAYWREHFKPWIAKLVGLAHAHHLPVIYHGCGNVASILEDFIQAGVDAYNPLEAKAGFDVVELRRRLGHRLAFCGNGDVRVWETGDREAIRGEVLHKLNAARGGGYIFQSDHSVTSGVSGPTYDFIVRLVREYGRYPLSLGQFTDPV
jgi:uroporphyrinogen decarboxylase